jgi:inner membrane transporter RhtA
MNVCFYLALDRLPLGTAVTIEVLGPLTLSVLAGRRWLSALWAALAFAGVLLLGGGAHDLDLVGVLFALGAAALWAAYILLSKRTGAVFPGLSGLAIGMAVGGVAVLPFALATAGGALWSPTVLLIGASVALLSSAAPYAVELLALRRLPAHAFAVLMALAPAVAALAGLAVLGQALSPMEYSGIALVVAAGVGAVRSAVPRAAEPREPIQAA